MPTQSTVMTVTCLFLSVLMLSCASVPRQAANKMSPEPVPSVEIRAMAFSSTGATLYYAIGSDRCELFAVDVSTRDRRSFRKLGFCPERLSTYEDGSVLAAGRRASEWLDSDGGALFEGRTILAAFDDSHLLERTADGLVWITPESSVTLDPPDLRSARIASGGILLAVEAGPEGERVVRFEGPTASGLTPYFEGIDSWDVSPRGDELVFSAQRDSNFDVGIVSTSGGEINWVAPDPADEKNVTWAPRGNKISYTFQSLDATLVRSVHVPTSFQVVFDVPLATVRQVAWEPRAERFALAIESPAAGPRIDWVGYQGEERANLVDADERLDSPVEARFWEEGSGVLLGPETVRYDQKLPTVVWIDKADPLAWRPEVARLREEGMAIVVTTVGRAGHLKSALDELPWVNAEHLYVVDLTGEAGGAASGIQRAGWLTVPGKGLPEGATILDGTTAVARAEAVSLLSDRERKRH